MPLNINLNTEICVYNNCTQQENRRCRRGDSFIAQASGNEVRQDSHHAAQLHPRKRSLLWRWGNIERGEGKLPPHWQLHHRPCRFKTCCRWKRKETGLLTCILLKADMVFSCFALVVWKICFYSTVLIHLSGQFRSEENSKNFQY